MLGISLKEALRQSVTRQFATFSRPSSMVKIYSTLDAFFVIKLLMSFILLNDFNAALNQPHFFCP